MVTIEKKDIWIIDTDPGCDDMMCLLYMLNRKDIDIKLISLVEGNTSMHNVCINIRKILKLTGRSEIPIYIGCMPILLGSGNAQHVHADDGLGGIADLQKLCFEDMKMTDGNAALKIIELLYEHPNEINILTIGPLTNLAVAFMLDPNIVNLVKDFYTMGGSFSFKGNISSAGEFNYTYDCLAPKIVLPNFKNVIMIPWEPIEQNIYKHEEFLLLKQNLINSGKKLHDNIYDICEKMFSSFTERRGGFMMCDLYAAICSFNKSAVKKCFIARLDPIVDCEELRGALYVNRKIKVMNFEDGLEKLRKMNEPGVQLVVESLDRDIIWGEFHSIYYA